MDFLYPTYDDKEFNIKIASKKEFSDLKTDHAIEDPEKESERLCNMSFELRPHQQFVRNFLSINTPYNSLLLYHGLGTGKTCSAIGVCEEMRTYMKQANINKRIIVVASPNVQENFKLQLFDDRKLTQINGLWNIEACSGKQFLDEINPTNLKNLKKERLLAQVARIIKNNYLFLGYIEFGNYIEKVITIEKEGLVKTEKEKLQKKKLERAFKNRMIVIDEVHNIRLSDDNKNKRIAVNLMKVAEIVDGTRLLLMSATPMYNSYKEIVWLLNLMNMNNGQMPIKESAIFDKQGNFVLGADGVQLGRQALSDAARGLVSFIRGDNPYTFPFRIYPTDFGIESSSRSDSFNYPKKSLVGTPIIQTIEYLDLFLVDVGSYQKKIYKKILSEMKNKQKKTKKELPTAENMEKFGYTVLQKPLEALNIVYPQIKQKGDANSDESKYDLETMVGKAGLNRIMTHEIDSGRRVNYKYKNKFLKKFGKIFTKELIGNYSPKIESIVSNVLKSEGIVLIYSQYLDGGLLPVALALEEAGILNYDSKGGAGLLHGSSAAVADKTNALKYALITGDKSLSANNAAIVKAAGADDNIDGSKLKVILISRAGSEGLDFKNIRQVHIMEPWYNTNRIEQIIGRGVRNCSHKNLPFTHRNVMIFLYGTKLENKSESADMYVYRLAEEKALKIGNVSRVLKESAVDCLLHAGQSGLTEEKFKMEKVQHLSNGTKINYKIGDKKYSQLCDFIEDCEYKCQFTEIDVTEDTHTYDETFIKDVANIKRSIKKLFANHYFYKKIDLLKLLHIQHNVSIEQIYFALNDIMKNPNEFLVDMYGRNGDLVNVGEYYFFQPGDLNHTHSSLFEKSRPLDFKREKLMLLKPKKVKGKQTEVEFDKTSYDILIKTITSNYEKTADSNTVSKGDYDWYKHCANVYESLEDFGITRELFEKYVVTHIIDMLPLEDKLLLLNYLYYDDSIELSTIEVKLKSVLDSKILKNNGIFIQHKGQSELYMRRENGWKEAQKTDYVEMKDVLQSIVASTIPNLNTILGFIIEFKKSYFVFKTKNLELKRHRGARCDQSSKKDTIKLLEEITKGVEVDENFFHLMNNVELCIFMELLLRYYNEEKKNSKVWFLEPEYSQLLKIEDYSRKVTK